MYTLEAALGWLCGGSLLEVTEEEKKPRSRLFATPLKPSGATGVAYLVRVRVRVRGRGSPTPTPDPNPNPRPDVDCSRVGATGISLGGMMAWYWAAADPRVSAIAPAIGVQSFRYA